MKRDEIRSLGFVPIPLPILARRDITAAEKVVLAFMVNDLRDNEVCYSAPPTIAQATGLSRRGVQNAIGNLRKLDIIEVVGHCKHGANTYRITITRSANSALLDSSSANDAQRTNCAPDYANSALLATHNLPTNIKKTKEEKEAAAPLPSATASGVSGSRSSTGQEQEGAKPDNTSTSSGKHQGTEKPPELPTSGGNYQASRGNEGMAEDPSTQVPAAPSPVAAAPAQPNSRPASEHGAAGTGSANPGCRQSGTASTARRGYSSDHASVVGYWCFANAGIQTTPDEWFSARLKLSPTNWNPAAVKPNDLHYPAADVGDQALAAWWTYLVACLRINAGLPIEKPSSFGRLTKQVKQLVANVGRPATVARMWAIYSRWSEIQAALAWHFQHGFAVDEYLLFNSKVKGVLENGAAVAPSPATTGEDAAIEKFRDAQRQKDLERVLGKK